MEPIYKDFSLEKLNELIQNQLVKLPKNTNWKALKMSCTPKGGLFTPKIQWAMQEIEYLGWYTQKIAISSHSIKKVDTEGNITF